MSLPRFFHPEKLSKDHNTNLSESAARHASLALRLSVGAKIILFDGEGGEYLAEITQITRKHTQVNILEKNNLSLESNINIHLFQGVSKPDKMDWVIQKAVELGVAEITPVITQHCAVKLTDKIILKKCEHWRGVIISACEQSGRNAIPALNNIKLFPEIFNPSIHNSLNLIFNPESTQKLSEIQPSIQNNNINIIIGPEGGFNTDEIKQAHNNGFISVRIGSRILRTETAATAAISAIQSRWGDF